MGKSKIEFIPFKAHHLKLMTLREWDRKFLSYAPELSEASADIFERNGVGWTGIVPEGVVGAGGLVKVLPGNYELWCYTTDLFLKYKLSIHRFAVSYIETFFNSPHVRRLQCLVDGDNFQAMGWAYVIFRECFPVVLEGYGPEGQAFYMFSKVK